MVKTFSKQRKFRRIGRRLRHSHLSAKKRLQRRKAKFVQKTEKNKNVKSELNQTNIPPAINTSNDILSKFSPNRNDFLYSERDNTLNDYLLREQAEFIPFIPLAISDPSISKKRHLTLYGLFDIIKQFIDKTGFKFPLDLEQKVIALYDLFLTNANSQNEMKMSYLARTIFACASLYDKEEGLNVFTNDYFQQYFTSDDEIDVLEAVDFNLNPVKPYDYFSLFCFTAEFERRNDAIFLNYLEKLKKKFNEIAINLLFNEESRKNSPSVNYVSIFKMAYDETKEFLPKEDNFINDYLVEFQNRIHYTNDNYLSAKTQIQKSCKILEEFKIKYAQKA